MVTYLWMRPSWPELRWDGSSLLEPLGRARRRQGQLLASGQHLGVAQLAEIVVEEARATAGIEGERLDRDTLRSSVARRLGIPHGGVTSVDRRADGLVEVIVDATHHHDEPLDEARLFGWHGALFPTGYSGLGKIVVGAWRAAASDPMRVVSGPMGRERVHFEAPPAPRMADEIAALLRWWEASRGEVEGFVRAALAHLWFLTIHPFEDGNGRIARALTELALAQDEGTSSRLYSMSSRIEAERVAYYTVLERTQRGDGDVTEWIAWFLGCLERAIDQSLSQVARAVDQARFWQAHAAESFNPRQRKAIARLLDAGPGGFEGGLTNRKYRSMTKTSPATAKRDLVDLLARGVLTSRPGGGRSASYDLAWHARSKSISDGTTICDNC